MFDERKHDRSGLVHAEVGKAKPGTRRILVCGQVFLTALVCIKPEWYGIMGVVTCPECVERLVPQRAPVNGDMKGDSNVR